jgi:translation initiation factor 6
MSVEQFNISGGPFVGIYCCANEDIVLVPLALEKEMVHRIEEVLKVRAVNMTLGGSNLLGALTCMNSKGLVMTSLADKAEYQQLSKDYNIVTTPDGLNAAGNNILCSDKGALVNPGFSTKMVAKISDALGVEVVKGTVGGVRTVGSAAIAVNTGVMCHPKATEEELSVLRDLFKVNVQIGTANYGSAMVGASVVANTKGAIAGSLSTGIELGRIEDALGFLD